MASLLSISPGLVSTADVALIGDKNPDGIFDLETIPGLALQDLYENRMRYAIHSTMGLQGRVVHLLVPRRHIRDQTGHVKALTWPAVELPERDHGSFSLQA